MLQLSFPIGPCRRAARALFFAVAFVAWPGALFAGAADKTVSKPSGHLTVEEAYRLSASGKLHLIDIRRPSEWHQTGVPHTAKPITMHQDLPAFLRKLRTATSLAPDLPVAFICAHGHRSSYMQKLLVRYGHTNTIDVGEGMLGSRSGPGWLKTGLPTTKWRSATSQ